MGLARQVAPEFKSCETITSNSAVTSREGGDAEMGDLTFLVAVESQSTCLTHDLNHMRLQEFVAYKVIHLRSLL